MAAAGAALAPNPMTRPAPIPGVTVGEAQIQENDGEFLNLMTDQGKWWQTPMTKDQLRAHDKGRTPPTPRDTP